eukprot:gene1977-6793_t
MVELGAALRVSKPIYELLLGVPTEEEDPFALQARAGAQSFREAAAGKPVRELTHLMWARMQALLATLHTWGEQPENQQYATAASDACSKIEKYWTGADRQMVIPTHGEGAAMFTAVPWEEYYRRVKVFDPAEKDAVENDLATYRHVVFTPSEIAQIEERGEWGVWLSTPKVEATPVQFWETRQTPASGMPTLARAALRHLRRPMTSCD